MTWARLDDHFPDHPKVAPLSDAAFRLHVAGICHAARLLTDGLLAEADVPRLVRNYRPKALKELLEEVWHGPNHECPRCPQPAPGYLLIHDYTVSNPSRQRVAEERQATAERKRRWQTRNASENAVPDAAKNGSRNGSPTRPDPARPEGSRAGVSEEPRALTSSPDAFGGDDSPQTKVPDETRDRNVSSIRDAQKRLRGGDS